jgi:DNA uptake protein ComE-like DNA-binding protein
VTAIMSFKIFLATMAILLSGGAVHAQGARSAPPAAPAASGQIDLNSASRDDLMTLDGIGEVRADAIIRARPFKAKTELVERRLIPESLYEKIADKVMARPPPAAPPARPAQPAPKRT